jgi:hypothetical protein
MKTTTSLLLAFGLSNALLIAQSTVPDRISYQGRVVNATGVGIGTGTPENRKILFRLFDAATGGTRVWSEEQTVTLADGNFSVLLGGGVAATFGGTPENPRPSLLSAFAGSDRYLEIVVDGGDGTFNASDTAIAPRQRLTSTAFAVRAATADAVAAGTDLNLRDPNNGLGWYGPPSRPFNGVNVDGPVLYGWNGGALGAVQGAAKSIALQWNSGGNIGIGTSPTGDFRLDVSGVARFNNGGIAAPQNAINGGPGMRLVLWPGSTTSTPYGFGIDNSTLYSVVPSNADHKWFGGTTNIMTLDGASGSLSVAGDIAIPPTKNVTLGDPNHGVGYYGSGAANKLTFAGRNVNGPVVHGWAGGALGTVEGGQKAALHWDSQQNVVIPGSLWAGRIDGVMLGGFKPTDPATGGASGNYIAFGHGGVSEDYIGYGNHTFYLKDSPGGGDTFEPNLSVGGRVGIGTDQPQAPLHVASTINESIMLDAYMDKDTVNAATSAFSWTGPNSILADGRIRASGFHVASDARIKKVIGRSSGKEDLAALDKIEITDYTLIDTVQNDKRSQKRVIAQQVEKVLPAAVNKSKNTVPDIMKKAPQAKGWITLKSDLKVGDRVRLMAKEKDEVQEVLEVKKDQFRTKLATEDKEVFVYGREVEDFRSVDYDAIAMLNVSATQELKRQQDTEIAALKAENAALKAELATVAKSNETQETRLAALEKALATSAKASAAAKSTAAR